MYIHTSTQTLRYDMPRYDTLHHVLLLFVIRLLILLLVLLTSLLELLPLARALA